MPDNDSTATAPRRFKREHRPDIALPNGKKLQPRRHFADEIGVSERTVKRLNPPTTYVGNVAYIEPDATVQLIADTLKRKNQPIKQRKA